MLGGRRVLDDIYDMDDGLYKNFGILIFQTEGARRKALVLMNAFCIMVRNGNINKSAKTLLRLLVAKYYFLPLNTGMYISYPIIPDTILFLCNIIPLRSHFSDKAYENSCTNYEINNREYL